MMYPENVVAFCAPEPPHGWRNEELRDLQALYSAHANGGRIVSWNTGATEAGDPQFYLVGPDPDRDCVLCLTRMGRLYVLEDGAGAIVAEDFRLAVIAAAAARMLARRRAPSFIARSLFALCTCRALIDQKIELMLAESTEHLTRVAPQFAALL